MPELPEVQTVVDDLEKVLPGLKIQDVWCDHEKLIKTSSFEIFKKDIVGRKFLSAERRGKNILIHLSSNKTLLIHLKMTGHLLNGKWKSQKGKWKSQTEGPIKDDPYNRFIHLIFFLSNPSIKLRAGGQQLALCDMRKFAKMMLFPTDQLEEIEDIKKLGPDPFDKKLTFKKFEEIFKNKPGRIKTVLMDQTLVSGIGNIYSDEILWEAGIHPLRKTNELSEEELKKIFNVIKPILRKALKARGSSNSDYRDASGEKGSFQNIQKAYQQTGTECKKKDGGVIEKIKIGGRTAHFCPIHQKTTL